MSPVEVDKHETKGSMAAHLWEHLEPLRKRQRIKLIPEYINEACDHYDPCDYLQRKMNVYRDYKDDLDYPESDETGDDDNDSERTFEFKPRCEGCGTECRSCAWNVVFRCEHGYAQLYMAKQFWDAPYVSSWNCDPHMYCWDCSRRTQGALREWNDAYEKQVAKASLQAVNKLPVAVQELVLGNVASSEKETHRACQCKSYKLVSWCINEND